MTASELADRLASAFPGLAASLQVPAVQASIYQQLCCFADFTQQVSRVGQQAQLRQCFELADDLLAHGDRSVVSAITTVYLYALHLNGTPQDLQLAHRLMPSHLWRAYDALRWSSRP